MAEYFLYYSGVLAQRYGDALILDIHVLQILLDELSLTIPIHVDEEPY